MTNLDTMLLRALKGAPLSVLLAIRYLGRAGTNDLDAATGYDHEAVARALRALASMGFIVKIRRYDGWQLLPVALQLPLFIPSQLGAGDVVSRERGKTALDRGNSALPLLEGVGVLVPDASVSMVLNTSSPPVIERGNSALDRGKTAFDRGNSALPNLLQSEAERLAEILVTRMTCRRKRALQAVLTALTRGESPEYVERQLIQWANWLAVDANHKGLRAPGMFVAAKLADAEPAPTDVCISWVDKSRYEELSQILAGEVPAPADPEVAFPEAAPELPAGDACEVWEKARVQLRLQLLRTTYEAWVQGTACLAHSATEFIIAVPDENAKEWLALRLLPVIERTLVSIVGCMPAVRFVAPDEVWEPEPGSIVHREMGKRE